MSLETELTGIVLKRQPYSEADEIITFYTRGQGKVRALSTGSRKLLSRLAPSLLPASETNIVLRGRTSLRRLIRAQTQRIFRALVSDSVKISAWYVISELVIRGTPDEQNNQELYELLLQTLDCLDQTEQSIAVVLTKFKLEFLSVIGVGLWHPTGSKIGEGKYFSNRRGGFFNTNIDRDAYWVNPADFAAFLTLKNHNLSELPRTLDLAGLPAVLHNFLQYHLEREIKAEKFFRQL